VRLLGLPYFRLLTLLAVCIVDFYIMCSVIQDFHYFVKGNENIAWKQTVFHLFLSSFHPSFSISGSQLFATFFSVLYTHFSSLFSVIFILSIKKFV